MNTIADPGSKKKTRQSALESRRHTPAGFSQQSKVYQSLKIVAVVTFMFVLYSTCARAQSPCGLNVNSISSTVTCPGGDNGIIDLSVGGVTGSLTYVWSNGSTEQDLIGVSAGTYTVTITDHLGCSVQYLDSVSEFALTGSITLVVQDPLCGLDNGSITTSPLTAVIWTDSNGDTIDINFIIDSLSAGKYYASIPAIGNLLVSSKGVTINSPIVIAGDLFNSTASFGPPLTSTPITADVVYVDDGVFPIHDLCSPPTLASAALLNGKIALVDRGGCTFSAKVDFAEAAGAVAVLIINHSFAGFPPGMAGSTTPGIPITAISYNDGAVIVEQLTLGNPVNISLQSDVIAYSPSSCILYEDSVELTFTGSLQVACSSNDVTCYGAGDGTAMVNVLNGTGIINYSWNTIPVQTTQTATGLTPGDYIVIVVDSNGCTGSCTVTISQPDLLEIDLDQQTNILCWGEHSAAIDISAIGGTPPYSYLWSTGETTEDIDSLYDGTYTVTVTGSNTCTAARTFNVTQNPRVIKGVQITNVVCYGGSDGHILLSVSGGVPPYLYQWSNGDTSFEADSLLAGSYTVTITDAVGCDTICEYWILEPNLLDATANVVDVSCNGASDGSATVYPTGGVPYTGGIYLYQWSNGQTGQTATGLQAGTYQVMITDSVWCLTTVVVQVVEPDPLICFPTITNVRCFGGSGGSIQVVVNGGTPPYSYNWSNGATTSLISGLTAGAYTLTVTDANGCSKTGTYNVLQPAALSYTLTTVDVSCNGASDGKAIANINTGGGTGFTYVWNTNPIQTSAIATGLSAGSYAVVITSPTNCIVIDSVVIAEPSELNTASVLTSPSCYGSADGSIALTIGGGSPPYTIIWSNGNTTANNGGLIGGAYTVTITDNKGCTLLQTINLTQPAALDLSGTIVSHISCFGGSNGYILSAVNGGSGPYNYIWNTGATTSTINNLAAGNYVLTVTDASGCTAIGSWNINSPAELTCLCNSNVNNISCYGASDGNATALPQGGTPPYTYLWSNGAISQTIVGLSAGNYTVTITDANGCIKVGFVTITQPAPITCTSQISTIMCNGGGTGAVALFVSGGTPPYTYLWSNGQTNSAAANLTVGSYVVTITDANNCVLIKNFNINEPPAISVTTTKLNVSCRGGSNGTASVIPSGGTAPYSYLWSNGKTTAYIIGLSAGTYTATVTDAGGCKKSSTVLISQPTKLLSFYLPTSPTCNGSSNGSINLLVTGGIAPYTYTWNNGKTTEDVSGLAAGVYYVLIKDRNGCATVSIIFLTGPNALTCSSSSSATSCFGASDGTASVFVSGGTGPYNYQWSNGQASATATALAAGAYTVTITDSKGCSKSASVNVNQPAAINCNVSILENILCNGGTGKLQVNASGGVPPYSYIWNTMPLQTTGIVNNIVAGTYSVLVSDANGCTSICTVVLNQPTVLSCAINSTDINCNGDSTGSATVTASGGTTPYSYNWSNGESTATIDSVSAGLYTVVITDANGCTSLCSVIITQAPVLIANTSSTSAACAGDSTGTATVSATGGTPAYTYLWSTGQTNSTATGLPVGVYSVIVTDANNCTLIKSGIQVIQNTTLTYDTILVNDISCTGLANGSASVVNVSGGTSPYFYLWSDGQSTATATGLAAAFYNITITDAQGCSITATIQIEEPVNSLVLDSVAVNNILCNGGLGSATAYASGGTLPYSYLWSNGAVTQNISNVATGTYIVTVSDNNGCNVSSSIVITEPTPLWCSASGTDALCFGESSGSATVDTIMGGTMPYAYLWSDGQTTRTATGLAAGAYTVIITDANGCSKIESAMLMAPSDLICFTNKTDNTCFGGTAGTATIFGLGGTPPYNYLWSDGQTTQMASGLANGNYTVIISDANSCSKVHGPIIIGSSSNMTLNISVGPISCYAGNDGSLAALVSGGSSPYFYSWSNGNVSSVINGLSSGTFTVTVTDFNGCTISGNTTLNHPDSISCSIVSTNPTCSGSADGIASLFATGGTPPFSYVWANGQTTMTATGLSGGSNFVNITDSKGCMKVVCVKLQDPAALLCGITSSNLVCNDDSSGTATAVVSGGTPPYSYLWNTGDTLAAIYNIAAGNYTVIITDNNGCTTTCNTLITEPVAISISINKTDATCGQDNGTVNATVSGGTAPYTYLWNTGNMSSGMNGLSAGTYTLIVIDSKGCLDSSSIVVTQGSTLTCNISSIVPPTCSGYSNGTATITASGGVFPYTYLWLTSPLQYSATATGLSAGNYTVIVTDDQGCTAICNVLISDPLPISCTIMQSSNLCNGGSSASATIMVAGGNAPFSYLWSNGQTSATATGLAAGLYTVVVTDNAGCSITKIVVITQLVSISCYTSSVKEVCGMNNGTATVNVLNGLPPFTYSWNTIPVQTTSTATGLSAGTYTATVTDANGCTSSCTSTVYELFPPAFLVNVVTPLCMGDNTGSVAVIGLSGGMPPYTFMWSTGSTNQILSGITAGTYTVTVSDQMGCTTSNTVVVSDRTEIIANAYSTDASCYLYNNGTAGVNPTGGTPPYTIQWSNGGSGNFIMNLTADIYWVMIIDANGCMIIDSAIVNEPQPLSSSITILDSASCNQNNGSAQVNPSGGTPPYTYLWDNGETTQTAVILHAGSNFVIITDSSGCTVTACVKVPGIDAINVVLTSTVYAGGQNIRCNGGTDGNINLTVISGGPATSYLWNDGVTTEDRVGLSAGTYTVTVSNGNCITMESITLTQPSQIIVNTMQHNVTCHGGNNGTASVFVSGGSAPFNYSWNTTSVQTTSTATGLTAGVYTVMISDANGCTSSAAVLILQPANPLSLFATVTHITCNGSSDGSIDIHISGGTSPYQYLWNDGTTTEDRTSLSAGPHTIIVTDAAGCVIVLCTVLSEPTPVICSISSSDVKCNGGSNGMAGIAVSGGVAPYSYLWSNGATTSQITGLSAITYTVTITDANSCTKTASVTINYSSGIIFGTPSITNVTCHDGTDGTATLNISGASPPYDYLWSNGQTTQTATGLSMGTYVVTIIDFNGCILVDTASVIVGGPTPIVIALTDSSEICSIQSDLSGYRHGQFFYDQWTGITVTAVANGNGVDTVIVFDSDTSGTVDPDLEVNVGPILIIPENITDNNGDSLVDSPNDNGTGGVMTFDFDECVTINSFKFVDQDFNILPVVTAYDSLGGIIIQVSVPNMGEGSVQVIALNATCVKKLVISSPTSFGVTDFNIDCGIVQGGCINGSVDLTAIGGTPGYMYLWSNGATTEDLSGVICDTYTVTVTDATGCTVTRSITIAPMVLTIDSIAKTDATGPGNSDGTATVYSSGGVTPHSYSWNTIPVQTTQTATGLPAAMWQVTVTDNDGCMEIGFVTISDGAPPKQINPNSLNHEWSVSLYPNPTQGVSTLSIRSTIETSVNIRVYDAKGGLIFNDEQDCTEGETLVTYSFEAYPAGVYQVLVESDQERNSIRFILE